MFSPEEIEMMRRDIAKNREDFRIRMGIPMSPVRLAQVEGFDCANCSKKVVGRIPIRRNENGPYFCCFLCGFDFAGKNGDIRAAEVAANIRAVIEKVGKS